MRGHIAFSVVLALFGAVAFLAACVLTAMLASGFLEAPDRAVLIVFIGVIGIEFAMSGLIVIALSWRFLKGTFSIPWTDAAVLGLTAAGLFPSIPILLWWFLRIRRDIVAAGETPDDLDA